MLWTAKESSYTLPAKVTSVTPVEVNGAGQDDGRVKLCFAIDTFDPLPTELRKEYETAEQHRYERRGARCRIVHVNSELTATGEGSHIFVVMTLENQGAMTPQRFIVNGRDVFWETPKDIN